MDVDFEAGGRIADQVVVKGDRARFKKQHDGRAAELEKPLFPAAFARTWCIGLYDAGDVEGATSI